MSGASSRNASSRQASAPSRQASSSRQKSRDDALSGGGLFASAPSSKDRPHSIVLGAAGTDRILGFLGEQRWTPLTSREPTREAGWPSVLPPPRPAILPASARVPDYCTRTLRLERWPFGFFGHHDAYAQIRRFLATTYGAVTDVVLEHGDGALELRGSGDDDAYSLPSVGPTDSSPPTSSHVSSRPPSRSGLDPRGDVPAPSGSAASASARAPGSAGDDSELQHFSSLLIHPSEPSRPGTSEYDDDDGDDALALFETSALRDRGDDGSPRSRGKPAPGAAPPPAQFPARERDPEPFGRVWVRFATQRAFGTAYEQLVGGRLRAPFGCELAVDATYDASGYYGARREKARRMAAARQWRKQKREERAAARRPRTPPEALEKRVMTVLRALRRTFDDGGDDGGDDGAPPEPAEDPGGTRDAAARAVSAIDRAEKLCRSMHRMSSLTDDYREELSTAVRTAERFTERIETIHSSRVRRLERRRVFGTILSPVETIRGLKRCGKFLQAVLEHDPDLDGVTVFVPNDGAFLGLPAEEAFEHECWGVHIVDGPYVVSDLSDQARVQPRHRDLRHALRFRFDMRGVCAMWLDSDSKPPRQARIVKSNIKCAGGTIIHVVDKILYPDG